MITYLELLQLIKDGKPPKFIKVLGEPFIWDETVYEDRYGNMLSDFTSQWDEIFLVEDKCIEVLETVRKERRTREIEAWKHVYNELIKYPLFIGIYDAKNGDINFEYGIQSVMEVIAVKAGCHHEYQKMMLENLAESEKRGKE